jgi:hypothetical protein
MKKTIISSLLIIIFCLGVFLIYIQIKNNKQEDVKVLINAEKDIWESYKNDEFNFKYPHNLRIIEDGDNIYLVKGVGDLFQDQIFSISKYERTNQVSIQDWWTLEGPQTHRQAPHSDTENEILISGHNSVLAVYDSERVSMGLGVFARINIYVLIDDNIFEITTYKIAEDVLSQFKDEGGIDKDGDITPEIIKQVEENQKVFWQVIESLEFTPL